MAEIDEKALAAAHEVALEIDIVSQPEETSRIVAAYLSALTPAQPVADGGLVLTIQNG